MIRRIKLSTFKVSMEVISRHELSLLQDTVLLANCARYAAAVTSRHLPSALRLLSEPGSHASGMERRSGFQECTPGVASDHMGRCATAVRKQQVN